MQGLSTSNLILGSGILSATGDALYINGGPLSFPFTKSTIFYAYAGIQSGSYTFPIWRAPYDCYITGIHGYRVSGTNAQVNARKNGSLSYSHLTGGILLTSANTWVSSGIILNGSYVQGDTLEAIVSGVVDTPRSVSVQVDFVVKKY